MIELKEILNQYINNGAVFQTSTDIVSINGRSKTVEVVEYQRPQGGKGSYHDAIVDFTEVYNNAAIRAATDAIEAEIAAELEAEAEAEKQRTEAEKALKAQHEAELEAEREKLANLIEKNNSTPKYQLVSTFVLGWILKLLITVVLVGLNGANGQFFLGDVLASTYIWTFAGLFGGMYLYTSLYKDADAFYYIRLVLPADLALAVFVKPFIGGEALKFESLWELITTGAGWGMILFVVIYGVQIFHAGNALFKFLNPNIDKEDVKEYRNNVLNVVKK